MDVQFAVAGLKQSILSLAGFRSYSGSEDELSEVSLTNKIFKMLLEITILNSVVPQLSW